MKTLTRTNTCKMQNLSEQLGNKINGCVRDFIAMIVEKYQVDERVLLDVWNGKCSYGGTSHRLCKKDCNVCYELSFASSDRAEFWSDQNEKRPREVFKSSHGKYWFDCAECKHSFETQLNSVNKGVWCPYCSHQKLCTEECSFCYELSFASSDRAEFWSDRNEKHPREVFKSSNRKYWFDCAECKHSFETQLDNVNNGVWCPYCSNTKLCAEEECSFCYELSFASSDRAEFWSDRNEKRPREVFKSSGVKYWFDCAECKHSFETQLNSVKGGKWCPYCSHQKLCTEECSFCYELSFASSDRAEFWSDQNEKRPREVFKSSGVKYWFDCAECKHSFETQLNSVNNGVWCPYCSNTKLCAEEECSFCYELSFASSDRAEFWSDRNEKRPREVFKSSGVKYWFDCAECKHSFEIRLSHVNNGVWCPKCVNKTEKKFFSKLQPLYPSLIHQYRVEWCCNTQEKGARKFPYDFYFPELKIIVEIHGPQHYCQVSNWPPPELQKERDIYKQECALQNGTTVIHMCQEEIYQDSFDWKRYIQSVLIEYKQPKCIILSMNPFMAERYKQFNPEIVAISCVSDL